MVALILSSFENGPILAISRFPEHQSFPLFLNVSDIPPSEKYSRDIEIAEACANGDSNAFKLLKEYDSFLIGILRTRGANDIEARDIVQNLWGDCVPRETDEKPCLIARYSGVSALSTWLATVSTNRLIDSKRRRKIDTVSETVEEEKFGKYLSSQDPSLTQDPTGAIRELLHDAIKEALESLDIEHRLMLRLVFIENLQQREIARMWNTSNTTVTRIFQSSMAQVRKRTLQAIKQREPWLELTWEDFVQIAAQIPKILF